ncbi:PTS system mannose/fructose/sorbose family transporter subunit IID [Clostridium sp. AF18-27]|nr:MULTISPECIES: PTS system mannose/fructose/sorbose family transporter subunit IID [Enterocloster]MBS5603133.1 PTS system mannose/fructose/sorbose family transporter subunit IID [Enterocloster asparagiformis]MDR3757096.1 PTS system mannose/fructose/sorbose family transporter subunit IID [Enterocloster sp.]RHR47346.1 PTS system mannose/fructose/sorbose family transporter subunit IID [Clostridium sp. AF18-27]
MAREKLSKKDLMTVFWRSFAIMGSMNYERMQGLGYAWSLFPCLKKIYKDNKTKLCDALSRHMAAFNCATAPIPFIMGITLAMEEQNADNDEFDASAISTIKVALMGPLAGIGDAFFWGVFRVVSAGIGVSFALSGSPLGALFFLILYNTPNILCRYFGLFLGYREGSSLLEKWTASGLLDRVTNSAGILGVMVIGSMIATMVNITTPMELNLQGAVVNFQSVCDQIMPKLLPLVATGAIYGALKKNVKTGMIMLAILAIGFVGSAIGLL